MTTKTALVLGAGGFIGGHLAEMAMDIAGKKLTIKHIDGPLGVRGRNSDNTLIKEKLGWAPTQPLKVGMEKTYKWIEEQVNKIK